MMEGLESLKYLQKYRHAFQSLNVMTYQMNKQRIHLYTGTDSVHSAIVHALVVEREVWDGAAWVGDFKDIQEAGKEDRG